MFRFEFILFYNYFFRSEEKKYFYYKHLYKINIVGIPTQVEIQGNSFQLVTL